MNAWIGEINVWLYGIASASAGAIVMLIRKINTSEKQIDLLRQEISIREEYNKEKIGRIEGSLSEIRTDIKLLIGKE